jgi:hypothetical protein
MYEYMGRRSRRWEGDRWLLTEEEEEKKKN